MTEVFVVRNQHGQYLSKQREWVSGREAGQLYRTEYKDEAVNTVFEVSAKEISLRAEPVLCRLDQRQLPQIDAPAEPDPASEFATKPADLSAALAAAEQDDAS